MGAKLTVLSEVCRGRTFDLIEGHYGIGRAENMEIQIVDPTISGMHCELIMDEEGRFRAVDMGYSTNGTRINGLLVDDSYLSNGDILQVGSVECMFECDDYGPITSMTGTKTNINIDGEAIALNATSNVAPHWWNSDNPNFRVAFKAVMVLLVVIVLALGGFLAWQILSPAK